MFKLDDYFQINGIKKTMANYSVIPLDYVVNVNGIYSVNLFLSG